MLNDKALLVNRFISVPKDLGDVNCGARGGLELRLYIRPYKKTR